MPMYISPRTYVNIKVTRVHVCVYLSIPLKTAFTIIFLFNLIEVKGMDMGHYYHMNKRCWTVA